MYPKLLIDHIEEIEENQGIKMSLKNGIRIWARCWCIQSNKVVWKRVFNRNEIKKFWEERFCLDGNCKTDLISVLSIL